MNKNLTKIAALNVSLAMAIGVGVALGVKNNVKSVRAAEETVSWTASAAENFGSAISSQGGTATGTISTGSYSWNYTRTLVSLESGKSDYIAYAENTWIQLGSGKSLESLVLTTSAIPGTIKSVSVTAATAGTHTLTVDVGGTKYLNASSLTTYSGNATAANPDPANCVKTGTGSSSGAITITIASSNTTTRKAMLIRSISVTYEEGSGPSVYTVTYDGNGGTGSMTDTTEYESGDTVTVRYCQFMPADNYHEFEEFNTQADGSGTSYMGGAQFTITGSVTLYAIWAIKDVTLADGNYTSTLSFVNPAPSEVDVLNSSSTKVGLTELKTTGITYDTSHSEYVIAANEAGYFEFTNHTNATIVKAVLDIYKYDNLTVYADGTSVHAGDNSNMGDHYNLEVNMDAENTVKVVANNSYTAKVYSITLYFEVDSLPTMHIGAYDADDPTVAYYAYYHDYEGSHTLYLYDEDNNVITGSATFTSSDDDVFAFYQAVGSHGYTFTTVAPGTATLTASVEGYKTTTRTVTVDAGTVTNLSMSGSMTKTSYSTAEDWDPSGLVVTATYNSGYQGDVTSQVTWSYSPAAPAEGVTSVVATATLSGETASTDAIAVTVTVAHAGTAEDPFTVAEAIAKAKEIGTTAAGPWVTQGIICKVQEWDSNYTNITYWISDTGFGGNDPSTTVQCFRGKYLEGAAVTVDNYEEFVVGATVVVTGNLVNYYGNTPEYAANNYPLSLVQPSSGDFDVTFVPPENIEVGDTGLFEATADTTNPEFTWYTSNSEVLDVNSSTGAWEALQMGVVRVTVSVVDGNKTGTAFADIVVNGGTLISPAAANSIAASLPDGATTEYYVYVEGYVAEFATSVKDGNPRAFDISTEDETSRIMVYTNVDPYAEFVNGLELGDAIRVKGQIQNFNGKYEIVNPVRTYSEYVALSFAFELLERTGEICAEYDGVTNNHDALELLWGNLAVKYSLLNDAQKIRLIDPESYGMGQTVLDAMERYDYITGKYGLTNFITGRTPTQFVNPVADATNNFNSNSNTMIIVISVIAAVSALSIGALLVIKKRKHN